jgi:hypothetical protein
MQQNMEESLIVMDHIRSSAVGCPRKSGWKSFPRFGGLFHNSTQAII